MDSWVRKISWRRNRVPTPIFLGFPCGSAGKESACNVGDLGWIPGLGRSPGEGKGSPLQCPACTKHTGPPQDTCLVAQSCPTLCDPMDCSPPGTSVHGDSPGKNVGVGCHALLPGDLPNPGIQPRSPALQADALTSEPPGKSCFI